MSSVRDSSGTSFLMSNSNLTLTEILDMGFVAALRGNSSPYTPQLEQWDHRTCPKFGESPLFVKSSESTPLASGEGKLWLGVEDVGPTVCRSPLNPDGQVFEQSSLTSEPLNQFNNSIVGIFYGAKESTPYKKEERLETSDLSVVDVAISKLQDSEVVVNVIGQKSAPPMWEISEINSALEENTPSLEVSISDLRFPNSSGESEPPVPAQPSSAPFAQWVGAKHKDVGRSFLQPFRYQRQLSASEIPITSFAPPTCSFKISAMSPDKMGDRQLEMTTGAQAT
ncbi:uncharacterized protein LOC142160515 [Mixophyes fleayi]|uniref:uncharacterized protein LOC142160515 n=1 Tax=Mixophyes fleayi TaxID=3061075 RepID=UPI003F4DB33F